MSTSHCRWLFLSVLLRKAAGAEEGVGFAVAQSQGKAATGGCPTTVGKPEGRWHGGLKRGEAVEDAGDVAGALKEVVEAYVLVG